MRHPGFACLFAALFGVVPVAAADDRAVCGFIGSPRDAAIEACSRILGSGNLDPREKASLLASRGLHYGRRDRDRAIADLDAAIALQPDLARVWWARAYFNQYAHDIRQDRQLRERIVADYSKAIALKPDYIDAYYARAGIFFAYEKDYDRAIADYGKIVEAKPDYVAAYVGRAIAYSRKGDHRLRLADLTEVVRLTHSRDAYTDRGNAYLAVKDYERAFADFTEAQRLDSRHPSPMAGLAAIYTAKGDYPQALALYEEAIKRAPHLTWVYTGRARTYLSMGAHDRALADVQRSLAMVPKNAGALNLRARIYEAIDRPQEAVADYRAALAADSDPRANEESRAGLRRLGAEP
jgi:tetratricopeptide (TPR) repeat protein